jgi:hypothetical protein
MAHQHLDTCRLDAWAGQLAIHQGKGGQAPVRLGPVRRQSLHPSKNLDNFIVKISMLNREQFQYFPDTAYDLDHRNRQHVQ